MNQVWATRRARFLFEVRDIRGEEAPLASATKDGVILREDLNYEVWNPQTDTSSYKLVEPADFVIGLRSFQHGISHSDVRGIVSPAYTILKPSKDIEPRFYKHYFRSNILISKLSNITQGIRQGQTIDIDAFRDLEFPVPSVEEQRRIADFLDAETSRIDHLIKLRSSQMQLLNERPWSHFQSLIENSDSRNLPLRRVLNSIIDGPFGSALKSDDYSESGAVVIRLGNIGFAEYKPASQVRIPSSVFATFSQFKVLEGDLLIAALGDAKNHAGRACVAPGIEPAMVKGKCFRARVDTNSTDVNFVAILLSSPIGESAIEGRGSTRSMINIEVVKSATLPFPDKVEQTRIAQMFHESRTASRLAIAACQHQLELIRERRNALITAAVTGQFDVSSASGRGVEV